MEGLRAFCEELAEDRPSPGGGSAAAGAGAIAAALLAMVCGITAKSKKHADRAEAMTALRHELMTFQEELIGSAKLDAEAYDMVVLASRRRRDYPGEDSDKAYDSAVKNACDVPLRTAEICVAVIRAGVRVAELGSSSTWSDTGSALMLAEAGFGGAAMNVKINIEEIRDEAYVEGARKKIDHLARDSVKWLSEARARLGAADGR